MSNSNIRLAGVPFTLGTYPTTTVRSNINVVPSTSPTNAINIMATASTNFKEVLHANPEIGTVTITNAQPAGSYIISVQVGTVTSIFPLNVNNTACSQGLFNVNTTVSAGDFPASIAIGDFNGDGKQDLAIANSVSDNISIRMGDGNGNFSGNNTISVADGPFSVAIGDFNGDSKQDLVTANYFADNISIRLGDGNGNFSGNTTINMADGSGYVAIGDFNGDNKQDIATANFVSNNVSIRLGDGNGNFSGNTTVNVGSFPNSVAIGDFNGDGKQDLATANSLSDNISVRLGDGNGNFNGTTTVSVGDGPQSIVIGDFNDDGKQDLATANYNKANVSVRLGDGNGNFNGTTTVSVGAGPQSIVIGDFNGDGKQDLATANFISDNISIRLGDGNGNFSGNTTFSVGDGPFSITIGDFNGDGIQDLTTTNHNSNNVSTLLGGNNEINLQGNATNIPDGHIIPESANHTDFGSVAIGNNLVRTFTIQNTGNVNLTISSISITGANASLFTLGTLTPASPILPGNSATFTVTFTPTTEGLKTATVIINNDDCNEAIYDFAIQGTICPTQITLASTADDYAAGIQLKTASITNGNITATNKITGTAQVTYQAKVIELKPGFQANGGTVFLAQMGGCN